MTNREKLIELLCNLPTPEFVIGTRRAGKKLITAGFIADHLIANGVTVQENVEISDELLKQLKSVPITICKEEPSIELVQEWISVEDRLPEIPERLAESPEPVLYMMKNTKTIYAGYYGEGGVWKDKYFRQYADSRNGVYADDVLCWMYQHDLPQPPKGE